MWFGRGSGMRSTARSPRCLPRAPAARRFRGSHPVDAALRGEGTVLSVCLRFGGSREKQPGSAIFAVALVGVGAAVLGLEELAEVLILAASGLEIEDEVLDAEPQVIE